MIKRFAFQICLLLSVCLLAVWGMVRESVQTQSTIKTTPTVIIDAGHEALENTIKTPKNHRQANVGIIPKTRLNSGFSPLLDKLICENEINLQIP